MIPAACICAFMVYITNTLRKKSYETSSVITAEELLRSFSQSTLS